jgi:histidinol phosphatase-like PHP family hydrolase
MPSISLILALAAAAIPAPAQLLFEMREMDMHLHAGLECEVSLDAWIDLAVADGRKAIVVLDHLELYRAADRKKAFAADYPLAAAGHRALMADFDALIARRKDVLLFKGWEIYEGELDTGVEAEPMRMADVIGWHISPAHGRQPPDGRSLLRRIRQILEIQKQFPVPMVVFHPFTMRVEHIQRKAKAEGRDLKSIGVSEYRFFQPGEQAEAARLLRGSSVYLEIADSQLRDMEDPACREALIADIKPLAEAGVQFTVSTDNHSVASAKRPFRPESHAPLYGVTAANTNGLIRDLLVLRARRGLGPAVRR